MARSRSTSQGPMDGAWGAVQGSISLPAELTTQAFNAGQAVYREAEANEFTDDAVVWLPEAAWHNDALRWFPADAVRALGFVPSSRDTHVPKVYSTIGTDPHVDDEGQGPVFVLVLANDGLKFKQGKHAHVTQVGEWFLFDDCRTHTVNPTRRSTSYVFLHVPLQAVLA